LPDRQETNAMRDSDLARVNTTRTKSIDAEQAANSGQPPTPLTPAAQGVTGVSGPHVDQLAVPIQCQLGGRVRDFRLLLRDNGLVLQGRAPTYYAKQLAQEMVMKVTELLVLANEIEVLSPTTGEGNES
jgi:hypothetical protein